jgi:hypothetical protein
MPMPRPLTRRLSDLAIDALAEAYGIECPLRRDRITELLKRVNSKAELLHQARLVARGIEDTGHVSDWQQRRVESWKLERVGALEDLELRQGPAPTPLPTRQDW